MTTLSAEECATLGSSVRAACARLLPDHRLRAVAYDAPAPGDRGFDRPLWAALCSQVGVAEVGIPENPDDGGWGIAAQAVIAHELGRVLAPVPFLPSAVLTTRLLSTVDDATELLGHLGQGHQSAAFAVTTRDGRFDGADLPLATDRSGRWRLSGSVRHVLGAAGADRIVVVATSDGHPQLYLVEREQQGVTVTAQPVLDATRPMAVLDLEDAVAEHLPVTGSVVKRIDESLMHTIAVLTAEQVGAAERVLEMSVEYSGVRKQFDRPIGSFQAIKHRCADMLVELEMARSASMAAVAAVDAASPEAPWLVSMAKAVCSETLRNAAHSNLQIHGGIGFTWEHAAGLYVKRARTDEVLFGLPTTHWERVAESMALVGGYQRDTDTDGVAAAS